MGAGSSLTELFTSMADAFGTRNSIGEGAGALNSPALTHVCTNRIRHNCGRFHFQSAGECWCGGGSGWAGTPDHTWGACRLVAGAECVFMMLSLQPFIRDCLFYALAACGMFYMLIDGQITADECYALLAAYAVYVIVVCSHNMIAR